MINEEGNMKNYIKFFVSLAVLGIGLNAAPVLLAQGGGGGGGEGPIPPTPAKPAPPPRPAKAVASTSEQFERAAEQVNAAQMELVKAESAMPWGVAGFGSSSSGQSLVIPREGADSKELEDCEEDLNVMARILEKAGGRHAEKGDKAMGIAVHTSIFGQASVPRNLYLDGYGAVFFLNVNYPLVAPPPRKAEAAPKEDTSAEWEETRRELYRPSAAAPNFTFVTPSGGMGSGPAEEYDAERVERLKQDLISALRNAAHIRKLKADETVTVVVAGRSGTSVEPKRVTRENRTGGGGGSYGGSTGTTMRLAGVVHINGGARGSKMILRATRADIDAMQKGQLSAEEFGKKVTVQVY
jgi:hypothetical protein